MGITGYTFGVVVKSDSQFKTFMDLIEYARANPGKMSFGSTGTGTSPHLLMEEVGMKTGVQFLHVPFKGNADSTQALMGGHVMAQSDATGWGRHVDAGAFRLLVTFGEKRTKWNAPTARELGIDIVSYSPYGIVGPKGMDPKVVKVLHDAFRKTLDDPEHMKVLAQLDQVYWYKSSDEYRQWAADTLKAERATIERVGLLVLLAAFGGPVIATSGNVSGEPVLTDPAEAEKRLATVADAFLHHDRPIVRPADDPVVRVAAGRRRPIRLGRGTAPLELELPAALPEPVLAVGGHLKLAVALAWGRRVVVSPHVGDMGTLRSEKVFEQVVAALQRLYDVRAAEFLCDAHPGYTTTRWVQAAGRPHSTVYHHHAHASALVTEHGATDTAIVFAWDGVGYGEDGTLWGGEIFRGRPGAWRRTASLRSFRLPGADKAGRATWRSAAAVAWEAGVECPVAVPDPIVREAWQRGVNAPRSSAAGRVFDAMAAIVLGVAEASFEGQGPMWLEAQAGPGGEFPRLPVAKDAEGLPQKFATQGQIGMNVAV